VNPPATADVVVIGGGPAGSTAANALAKKGYEVVLLEQARHPRHTVGESVLPHFWKYAEELGVLDDIEQAGFVKKAGGLTFWRGELRQARLSDFGFSRPGMHVERDRFDHLLLQGAKRRGAQVFEEVRVQKVLRADDGRVCGVAYTDLQGRASGEIRCRFVVDGSGQAAVVANQLGFRHFDEDLRFMSVWGYYEGGDYVANGGVVHPFADRFTEGCWPMTLVTGQGPWGWCWQIVQSEATSIGLVMPVSEVPSFKSHGTTLAERFEHQVRSLPVISSLLADAQRVPGPVHAVRDFAYRPTQLCGDGWYLAGDAAAFVDPINSAGVTVSFYTGFLASWAISASLDRPERADYYAGLFDNMVRRRLALYRISALPEGVNSYAEEDYPQALKAAQLSSALEQELLQVQCRLTHRSANLAPLLEQDERLNYRDTDRYQCLPHLVSAAGEPWAPS